MEQQEKMYALVEDFHKSGKSQKDFFTERGMSSSTFSYWIKKKRLQDHPSERFIKIATATSSEAGSLEIIYPNGVRLKTTQTELSLISALIRLY